MVKKLGRLYRINDNLYITIRGTPKSAGFNGTKIACFTAAPGAKTLFNQEHLPPTFTDINNATRQINSKWFAQGEIIIFTSELPQETIKQYKIEQYQLTSLQLTENPRVQPEQW